MHEVMHVFLNLVSIWEAIFQKIVPKGETIIKCAEPFACVRGQVPVYAGMASIRTSRSLGFHLTLLIHHECKTVPRGAVLRLLLGFPAGTGTVMRAIISTSSSLLVKHFQMLQMRTSFEHFFGVEQAWCYKRSSRCFFF